MPYKDKRQTLQNVKRLIEDRRVLLRQIKNVPCADCGVEYPYYVMQLDHVRGKKIKNVSLMLTASLENFLIEVAKCDIVCANCHAGRTHQRRV